MGVSGIKALSFFGVNVPTARSKKNLKWKFELFRQRAASFKALQKQKTTF